MDNPAKFCTVFWTESLSHATVLPHNPLNGIPSEADISVKLAEAIAHATKQEHIEILNVEFYSEADARKLQLELLNDQEPDPTDVLAAMDRELEDTVLCSIVACANRRDYKGIARVLAEVGLLPEHRKDG